MHGVPGSFKPFVLPRKHTATRTACLHNILITGNKGLTLLLLTYHISVMAMAYSLILSSLLSQLINTWPNRKLLDYRYLEQLKDILPSILLAVFMGCCMWLVNLAHLPDIVTLVIQILIGASVYLGGSALLKLDTFEYLWNVVKPKIQRKPWADNEE